MCEASALCAFILHYGLHAIDLFIIISQHALARTHTQPGAVANSKKKSKYAPANAPDSPDTPTDLPTDPPTNEPRTQLRTPIFPEARSDEKSKLNENKHEMQMTRSAYGSAGGAPVIIVYNNSLTSLGLL